MSDISISTGNTERIVAELTNKIRTEIMDAGAASADRIISAAERSAGDFIEALKEEVVQEAAVMNLTGELLIAMAEYILSAANAFAEADEAYRISKVSTGR